MDETKLIELITSLGEALRTEVADAMGKISQRCDALDEKMAKKVLDEGYGKAEQVAADEEAAGHRTVINKEMRADSTSRVTRAEFEATQAQLRDLQMKQPQRRPMADLDAYADAQAKADAVMRANGDSASPPMAGEELIPYQIRLARPMQRLSKAWKNVDLRVIAADQNAFAIALDGIRSDAMAASMNFDNAPEFAHRMITKTMPGGHICQEFVGRGTFIKAMSRPVRHVSRIGVRSAARN